MNCLTDRVDKLERASSSNCGFKGARLLAGILQGWKVRTAAHDHKCASPTCMCPYPSYSRLIPTGTQYVDTWDYEMNNTRYHRGCNPYLNPNKEVKGKRLPPVPKRRSNRNFPVVKVTVENEATFKRGCFCCLGRIKWKKILKFLLVMAGLFVLGAVLGQVVHMFSCHLPHGVIIDPSVLKSLVIK
jgi:hypothetical protein